MAKLWDKGYQLDQLIEDFTVGQDYLLDKNLVLYDCLGNIAHTQMLNSIGILTDEECNKLVHELKKIVQEAQTGTFQISKEQEDVHTAIENRLTNILGDAGKKIHTCRSRNDQVLVDVRMYMRDQVLGIMDYTLELCSTLLAQAQKHEYTPIVGRTHFQKAMMSSGGLLFGAYVESLLDNVEVLVNAYSLIDQCPLGSGASYGVTLPIDRQLTSDLLGFNKVQNNALYANNSRGKSESIMLHGFVQIMNDLSKLATDLILFSTPEFGYFTIPDSMTSGSSLMPNKKNPCGLELVRAKSATVMANLFQVLSVIRALPSGYNRDFQETKKPLMESCDLVAQSLQVCAFTIKNLTVNKQACLDAITPDVYATDHALRGAAQGIPFRDVYKQVALELNKLTQEDPIANLQSKQSIGAPGNLGVEKNKTRVNDYAGWIKSKRMIIDTAFKKLIGDGHD